VGIGAGGEVLILMTTVNSLKIGDLEFLNNWSSLFSYDYHNVVKIIYY